MRHHVHAVAAVAALAVVAAAEAGVAASPYGTWLGTPVLGGKHGPGYIYDPIKLVAAAAHVQVESTGLTIASHDAATAKSTCTTRYRFNTALSKDGWRVYVQEARPALSGSVSGGPPAYGICGSSLGAYRDAVRFRPAGTKLRVEFGSLRPAEKTLAPNDFDPAFSKRGYLHR